MRQGLSPGLIRTLTLERLALGIVPLFAAFGLLLLIAGVFWRIAVPTWVTTLYLDSLYGLCAPLVLGLAGQNAVAMWGGGLVGGLGYGYQEPLAPLGTMGSGVATQNPPVDAPPPQ